jgi:regulatory protein SWI5
MLSNPTNLHQRQRQHRRQLSTPTAYEAAKVPDLPNIRRNASHKRGISLDQRQRRQSPQDIKSVSTTNHGFQQIQQHILREAQQQRLARPGPQQQAQYQYQTNDENYLISPLVSPQSQHFDTGCISLYRNSSRSPLPTNSSYSRQINSPVIESNDSCINGLFPNDVSLLFTHDGLPHQYMDFSAQREDPTVQQDWRISRSSSRSSSGRRISGGISDRVRMFEGMGDQKFPSRPITPPTQNASSKFDDQTSLRNFQ